MTLGEACTDVWSWNISGGGSDDSSRHDEYDDDDGDDVSKQPLYLSCFAAFNVVIVRCLCGTLYFSELKVACHAFVLKRTYPTIPESC